jgi:cytoskeletal protein RodZ
MDDDAPVVAPPPRKQPASGQPGAVAAPPQRNKRPGRAAVPGAASSSGQDARKPLQHSIQPVQSLGQTLSAIRNARGLSIEEVALATRIRLEYLTELEADELLKVLPTVYVSAYVRKLIDIYDLSPEDSELLIEKMHGEIPQDPEELPDKLLESVNEGGMVNEGENKRIRNITILFFSGVAVIFIAIVWLIILLIVRHSRKPDTVPERTPAAVTSGEAADPAAAATPDDARTQPPGITESDFDALIPPEQPDTTILSQGNKRGVRNTP